jgi:transposase InsO family protein
VKFAFIHAEKAAWPVSIMCRVLRVSKSGLYASQRRPESQRARDDRRLSALAREAHEIGRRAYGRPRIHRELVARGVIVGRKRVIRLMKAEGLKGKVRRRFVRTTDSDHALPTASNLLAREFHADGPNQRWVSDITYLRTPQGWMYLAAVLDLYSRYLVGWAVSAVIDRHLVLRALEMAIKRRCPSAGLLHHSDQGSQYASEDYQKALEARDITCSMSRRGNCYDNAAVRLEHLRALRRPILLLHGLHVVCADACP